MTMIAVANRIPVNPAHAQAFEERFLSRPGNVETQPGFVGTHLLRPTAEGQPYTVLTYWESREAFEAWRTSPDFREGHKGRHSLPEGTVMGRNELEIWEVFSRTGTALAAPAQ